MNPGSGDPTTTLCIGPCADATDRTKQVMHALLTLAIFRIN